MHDAWHIRLLIVFIWDIKFYHIFILLLSPRYHIFWLLAAFTYWYCERWANTVRQIPMLTPQYRASHMALLFFYYIITMLLLTVLICTFAAFFSIEYTYFIDIINRDTPKQDGWYAGFQHWFFYISLLGLSEMPSQSFEILFIFMFSMDYISFISRHMW